MNTVIKHPFIDHYTATFTSYQQKNPSLMYTVYIRVLYRELTDNMVITEKSKIELLKLFSFNVCKQIIDHAESKSKLLHDMKYYCEVEDQNLREVYDYMIECIESMK